MSEPDIVNDLLACDPNEPASKGIILLLRAEMKSGFKSIDQRFEQQDKRMDKLEQRMDVMQITIDKISHSLEMVAQQVAFLVSKASD